MEISNLEKQTQPEEPRFLDFACVPDGEMRDGKPILNKYSSILTRDHDFPGAQVSGFLSIPLTVMFNMEEGYAVCRWRPRQASDEE